MKNEIPNITKLATNDALKAKINEVKSEIPSITNSDTNASLNATINELKNEIPSVTNLATITVENKIPNVSDLVRKADHDTKMKRYQK